MEFARPPVCLCACVCGCLCVRLFALRGRLCAVRAKSSSAAALPASAQAAAEDVSGPERAAGPKSKQADNYLLARSLVPLRNAE